MGNSHSFQSWCYLLYTYVSEALVSGSWLQCGPHVEFLLRIFQTLALLEVIHAVLGLVRSSPFTTMVQISSRLFVVWGVLYLLPEVKKQSIGVPLILIAWCLAEIIRYIFYALNICNISSSPITWLRYSSFLLLYPIGITGELVLMCGAVQALKGTDRYSFAMPNMLNCSFDYRLSILAIMALYIPGAPKLYMYMLSQRRKVFKTKMQ
ncbi:Very-long-chain (3R)-3-hydroxyacyl-CoA dehydratase PASTICCINO 2 [Fasciola gigantica]|uniref:Very-long-chain (3R)-3-hydroxyacyl-CoA dehydratase n=1 Tax=Fasciola gigantica TaxID=46835 RepID=A0A504YRZ8_FASGI|nr:Very-long-chain (3R)-3-hydroxyacyl-CoA dehydratase PASTICCINO 2 [Fasciola gigantica]